MIAKPNVLWIFLDQLRADVLGCYGHPWIQTPNLDRLAASGVLFEQVYCQNPICVPSRVSILSGLYCHHTGVYGNDDKMRPADSQLLQGFLAAGYRTASIGKVHLGIKPEVAGFQEHHPIVHDGIPHMRVPADYPPDWPWRTFTAPGFPQPVIYATDICPRERTYCAVGVDQARAIFTSHDFAAQPLLLRLSLDRPHTPVSSPKPYDTMYAAQTTLPTYDAVEQAGQPPHLRDYLRKRQWDQFTPDELLKIRYYYYGLVTHLDAEIGRLLDTLEQSPQRDNTLIALTVDHGCMLGEHGLQVKSPHQHVETTRVPLLLSWPGHLPAGRRVSELVELVDFMPTLFELCGLPPAARADGRSLVPLIQGQAPGRDWVFAEQGRPGTPLHWHGVRTTRYAYTEYTVAQDAQLFDLLTDPHERHNLLRDDVSHVAVVAEMQEKIVKSKE